MTIQVLTDEEIDAIRDHIGYVDPRAIESALISKLAAGELPEPATWGLKDFVTRCERPLFTADQLRLASAQGAASILSSEPSAHLDVRRLQSLVEARDAEIERLTESLRYEVDCVAVIGAERDQACAELAAIRAQAEVALGYLNKWQKNGGTKAGYEFVDAAIASLTTSPAAKDAGLVADGWKPIETAPKQQIVLIHYKNSLGNGRTVKARFTPRYTEEASSDSDEGVEEYDAENDRCTLVEGWWEQIDNWGDFSEVYIDEHKPTHWMPLPAAPKIGGV